MWRDIYGKGNGKTYNATISKISEEGIVRVRWVGEAFDSSLHISRISKIHRQLEHEEEKRQQRQVLLTHCRNNHPLRTITTPVSGYTCDICSNRQQKGAKLQGCR